MNSEEVAWKLDGRDCGALEETKLVMIDGAGALSLLLSKRGGRKRRKGNGEMLQ